MPQPYRLLLICLVFLLAACQQEPDETPTLNTANTAAPTSTPQSTLIPTEPETAVPTTEPANTAESPTPTPETAEPTPQSTAG